MPRVGLLVPEPAVNRLGEALQVLTRRAGFGLVYNRHDDNGPAIILEPLHLRLDAVLRVKGPVPRDPTAQLLGVAVVDQDQHPR